MLKLDGDKAKSSPVWQTSRSGPCIPGHSKLEAAAARSFFCQHKWLKAVVVACYHFADLSDPRLLAYLVERRRRAPTIEIGGGQYD
jgi:hypothetical protein